MEGTNEIKSITDLVKILTYLGEPTEGHTRFFRGQGDETWEILPSIYRNAKLVENEDKIIKEALVNCPDDFLPTDTLLEKLVKLQHYGYPTRLLDLTVNALAGLYFAVSNNRHWDKDGELVILDIPNEFVKYDDSDTVAIITALSLVNSAFSLSEVQQEWLIGNLGFIDHHVDKIKEYLIKLQNVIDAPEDEKLGNIILAYLKKSNMSKEDFIQEQQEILSKNFGIEYFNKHRFMVSLHNVIKKDKLVFQPLIDINDLKKVVCVRTKLSNVRISRQQGGFLAFGIQDDKFQPAKIPHFWQRKLDNNKFVVKANAKANILKELKAFGISKQTLFPELESQASEIIEQYIK